MTRASVRELIESAINDLALSMGFGSGLVTDFNSLPDKSMPYAWLDSLSNSPEITDNQLVIDNWNCLIRIAQKDALDSDPETYESIIDDCDEIAKAIIQKVNLQVSGYKLLLLKSLSIDPFVKDYADCLSGVNLTFIINVPDTVNRCDS